MPATVKRTISLRPEQAEWLKEHPEVNFSGHVQRWLDNLIEAYAGNIDSQAAEIKRLKAELDDLWNRLERCT